MINIAICDDNMEECKFIRNLLTLYANRFQQYEIDIYEFSAPLELLTYISNKGGFDILILDIYMPGILGTEVARDLRKLGDDCEIIFITTSREHAIEAFEVRMTSKNMFELFCKNKSFIRCGASISLNLKYVRKISKDSIIFDTGMKLLYPYRVHKELKEAFLNFQMDDN